MNLRSKGQNVKTSLTGLFGWRKQSRSQIQVTDVGSDVTTGSPPDLVVQRNAWPAIETHRDMDTSVVGNAKNVNDALSEDIQNAASSTLHCGVHKIVTSEYEAPDVYTNTTGGILNNANHLLLNNPTMVDNSTKAHSELKQSVAKKLLSKHIIPGAAHDSSARDPPPKCHPGTRIKINERIMDWFYTEAKAELILRIHGPAGVGKSVIVQTLAEVLALAKCLGASVFFSRPNRRNDSRSVFITIAYQFAVHIQSYCAFICELLAFDPEIVNKSMEEQFRAFIIKPFVEKKIGEGGKAWGILLDGLDELDERDRQREIIRLITTFVHDHPKIPLVWVISSRPEPHITNTFKQQRLVCNYKEEYVPIDSPEACQDVEHYLRSSFEIIQQVKFPHIVGEDWPEETKIVKLAHAASGLFAFADVAVRYIEDPNHADPITRLDDVLSVVDGCRVGSAVDQPFALLDALYTRIITRIPPKIWPTTQRVLGAITASNLFSRLDCVKGFSVVLGLELNKVYASINDFYSVLDIPPLGDVYSRGFRFHHASFVDFLRDATRANEYYISYDNARHDLRESGLRIWLDFKRQSSQGPSSDYSDKWSRYASQFHSKANQSRDTCGRFDGSLSEYVHAALWNSLWEKHNTVKQDMSQRHWDELLDLLCQVDAGTACHGFGPLAKKLAVELWFDIWKTYREEFTNRGVVREIRLEQLQLDHLEWPREYPTHAHFAHPRKKAGKFSPVILIKPSTPESFSDYISGLKYFQQDNPALQVLICGPPGHHFAIFAYKYTEDDFEKRSLHTGKKFSKVDKYDYSGYYCIPYPDNV
ncbi:hypothetical protein AGABI2DRAFT_123107 [Agaricus bisporus var. bisporus H97]|uniref:hypothetical protein n=1 Tax=Agaricus bisporus var. bisporus (strain H97 / ATCC MYA-4626 / FGSC 10389) TaxID=936046 RepID=UPI00029F501B|nr:hypothetical protein AGABI2DRAFT_123107 [Agaricus bisporus var. bisporus H97]EKV41986.1 hypothetical protein AGABI2DRAFT_123107 [Agaricus bisporus var. bisporus H97]